jgi:hypothetical protein
LSAAQIDAKSNREQESLIKTRFLRRRTASALERLGKSYEHVDQTIVLKNVALSSLKFSFVLEVICDKN